MRQKRTPNFQVEVDYKKVPDEKDRLRQLWDLLIALPDSERQTDVGKENHKNHERFYNIQNTR